METLSQKCTCLNYMKTVKMGHFHERRLKPRVMYAWLLAFSMMGLSGCQLDNMNDARKFAKVILLTSDPQVEVKPTGKYEYRGPIRRLWAQRELPSERTRLFLRQNNLDKGYKSSPADIVAYVQQNCRQNPTVA